MASCKRCGDEIVGRRNHAKFCSDSCRVRASEERHSSGVVIAQAHLDRVRGATRQVMTTLQAFEAAHADPDANFPDIRQAIIALQEFDGVLETGLVAKTQGTAKRVRGPDGPEAKAS